MREDVRINWHLDKDMMRGAVRLAFALYDRGKRLDCDLAVEEHHLMWGQSSIEHFADTHAAGMVREIAQEAQHLLKPEVAFSHAHSPMTVTSGAAPDFKSANTSNMPDEDMLWVRPPSPPAVSRPESGKGDKSADMRVEKAKPADWGAFS